MFWIAIAIVAWLTGVYASIVFGVLAAVVVERYGPIHQTIVSKATIFALTAGAATGLAAGFDYDLSAPLCSIGIVLLLTVRGPQQRLGAIVGGVSYPMYLNHWVVPYLLNPVFKNTALGSFPAPLRHALAIVLGTAFSFFLYWTVDRRLLAKRSGWFTESRGWAALAAAYCLVAMGIAFGLWWNFRP